MQAAVLKLALDTPSPILSKPKSTKCNNDTFSIEGTVEALKSMLPNSLRRWLSERRLNLRRKLLPFDRVTDFSRLRRLTPYRPAFGWHRGQCIDRYYIEAFLSANQDAIYGSVLEVCSDEYTRRFGGERVTKFNVIDLDERNSARTITADLSHCDAIGDDVFDCIICTQTLPFIYDFAATVRELHRILKPGGVVLATVPGISQICPANMIGAGADYWRFTRHSTKRVFAECFEDENTQVVTYGNVLAAVAFLHGLVVPELSAEELDYHDPDYEVTVAIRARKSVTGTNE
jgi:SAM-dependent methyltransferase